MEQKGTKGTKGRGQWHAVTSMRNVLMVATVLAGLLALGVRGKVVRFAWEYPYPARTNITFDLERATVLTGPWVVVTNVAWPTLTAEDDDVPEGSSFWRVHVVVK